MKTKIPVLLLAMIGLALNSVARAQSDISLTGYTQTFDEEFNSLSVTTNSPKGTSTWYYFPPYGSAGAFSASQWDISALSVTNGILSDQAFLDASNNWHSGNISSMDTTGAGFSQQYGYFEIRAQMPNSGTGAWPAFWLNTRNSIVNKTVAQEEVDIFEWYGVSHDSSPGLIQQASHNWNADGTQDPGELYSPATPMPDGSQPWKAYHIYGCQIDPVHMTWYIDGVQTNQVATPTSHLTSPFYIMVDYALGGGWPLTGMVNKSSLNVDWVRVYSLPATGTGTGTGGGTGSSSTNAIGIQFKGLGTVMLATDSAGVPSVAQTNWNVLTGSYFSNTALIDGTGTATTATLSGTSNGFFFGGGSSLSPTGNSELASGELFNGWPGSPLLTVANIPYAQYDVYAYAGIDANGRNETVSLTPAGGSAQSFSFTTEAGGSAWTAATSTWNGVGTAPTLPKGNYVHFAGLTASSFTMAWGAPGNGGLNGIQIVPATTSTPTVTAPTITTQPTSQAVTVGQTATFSVSAAGTAPLSYQWEANGTPISGATSAAYTTPATVSGNSGSTFMVLVGNSAGSVTSAAATLTVNPVVVVTPPPAGTASIGIQFSGMGTAMLASDSAGIANVAQTNWNVLAGSYFNNTTLSDSTGTATGATVSGYSNGTYWGGGSSVAPSGNGELASGELFNGWPGSPVLTISKIPYAKYDVYIYAGIDASGRAETISLTPASSATLSYSFTTETGGSAWTLATSTWNGTGATPSLPSANYVHFSGLTGASFSLSWGAPGNGGLNGIQIVPTP